VTVLSCAGGEPRGPCAGLKAGEAPATLRLGRSTKLVPRYYCEDGLECECPEGQECDPEGLDSPTQVGLNLVTAWSGNAILGEPFLAFAEPDYRFDGTYRWVEIDLLAPPRHGWILNLAVADRLALSVGDQHGNPISNADIVVKYRPDPIQAPPPPGWSLLRGPTTTPGRVLKPKDYLRCIETTPSVLYGECPGEAASVTVRSSTVGAFAYPLVGDSHYSDFYFDIGTPITPNVTWVSYGTSGWVCHAPDPEACGHAGRAPVVWVSTGPGRSS